MRHLSRLLRAPITYVLAAALAAAIVVFRDYGLTWDEPLFYQYAEALGYAYTPANWTSPDFDLSNAYGPSGDDHKTRGSGYLLLARLPARALQAAGLPLDDSWHLLNSITFVVSVYFVYALARRVATPGASALAAALFASQPLLWGHAFINPKDIPFMMFFTGSVWLGWRVADRRIDGAERSAPGEFSSILLAAAFLGLATSNRILGPLAGLLVIGYWLARRASWTEARWILTYVGIAAAVTLATWPYLWENLFNFVDVLGFMAQNPTVLPVLFAGQVFPASQLPLRYLPFYLAASLTEPVWPFFLTGVAGRLLRGTNSRAYRLHLLLLLVWLLLPLSYVLALRPPLYDGMRHFLFVLPPAFVLAAAGIDLVLVRVRNKLARAALVVALILPGLSGIVQLHPYEYAYFNSIVGGTAGAFRRYETDYWLTCYKEAIRTFQTNQPAAARMFIHREPEVAAMYANPNLTVVPSRGLRQSMQTGDYVLINTRTNEDLHHYRDATELLNVGRGGAVFCIIKRLP